MVAWRRKACIASRWLAAGLACTLLAGCAKTSRVGDDVSTQSLTRSGKAVALMRVGTPSPKCNSLGVLLGTREGNGFRRKQPIGVANVRSLADVPVAEVELEPGEYHVLAFSCIGDKGPAIVGDNAAEAGLYRSSYASFTLQAGEVVNVGSLTFNASHTGRSTFGREVRVDVEVVDWPLAELERFRQRRPALYAAMKTRLMTVAPRGPQTANAQGATCTRARQLQAEGKLAALPNGC